MSGKDFKMLLGKSCRFLSLASSIHLLLLLVTPQAIADEMQATPSAQVERQSIRLNIGQCWNVGNLSREALNTSVVVEVKMNPDGTPIRESIRLVESFGGSRSAAEQTFESARRAIIRCGAAGFDLPLESYHLWETVELHFHPVPAR